jgi:hypothetical protein
VASQALRVTRPTMFEGLLRCGVQHVICIGSGRLSLQRQKEELRSMRNSRSKSRGRWPVRLQTSQYRGVTIELTCDAGHTKVPCTRHCCTLPSLPMQLTGAQLHAQPARSIAHQPCTTRGSVYVPTLHTNAFQFHLRGSNQLRDSNKENIVITVQTVWCKPDVRHTKQQAQAPHSP